MIRFLTRHRQAIFIATVTVFLIGIFVGLGGYLFVETDTAQAVAQVGKQRLPYQHLSIQAQRITEKMQEQKQEVSETLRRQIKEDILREMIVEELLFQEAGKMGMKVTDMELAHDIQNNPSFQREGQFDHSLYYHSVRAFFQMTPEQFETWRRKSILAAKLRQFIFQSAKLTPIQLQMAYLENHPADPKKFEKEKEEFQKTSTPSAKKAVQLRSRIRSADLASQFWT